MRFPVIVADPPWSYEDKLRMGGTVGIKRSADSHYPVMPLDDIKALQIPAVDDAVLALWCPSTLIFSHGGPTMEAWGFKFKQLYHWVKTSKGESGLAFGMGRYFRNCSETALIGVRGKPRLHDFSQRNVELSPQMPHSAKPETLQTRLASMYFGPYLEMFARRGLEGWYCIGNEAPDTKGEDIRLSLMRVAAISDSLTVRLGAYAL